MQTCRRTDTLGSLEAALQVILGDVRLLVPHVLLSRGIDLGELVLRWAHLVGSLLGSIGGDIAQQYRCVTH